MSTPVPYNSSRARIKRVRAGVFFFSSLSGLDIEFKLTWLTAAKSRTVTHFFVSTKKAPQSIWGAAKNILFRGIFKQITGLAVQQLADHLNV